MVAQIMTILGVEGSTYELLAFIVSSFVVFALLDRLTGFVLSFFNR